MSDTTTDPEMSQVLGGAVVALMVGLLAKAYLPILGLFSLVLFVPMSIGYCLWLLMLVVDSRHRCIQKSRPVMALQFTLMPTLHFGTFLYCTGPQYQSDFAGASDGRLLWIGWAGATLLPIWLAGCVSLWHSLFHPERLYRSVPNFIMMSTLALICACYAGLTVWLGESGFPSDVPEVFALVPLAAMVQFGLLALHVLLRGELQGKFGWFPLSWLGGLMALTAIKVPLAQWLFERLPAERPPEGCFVVSAAARGHRRFVGSWLDPATGRPVNRQLQRLRAFEDALRIGFPRLHRLLRAIYNRIGPSIARRTGHPLLADVTYLLLKPLELLASAVGCDGAKRNRAFAKSGGGQNEH